jgi:lipoate-protein ligase A
MGVPAKFEGKNDLRVNGLKISGNAEHVFKNRVLHHGTLLFSSDLTCLNKAIKVKENRFDDKAVKSNRSEVANILDFLSYPVAIEEFKDSIIDFVSRKYTDTKFSSLTENDISAINKLVDEKYSTWKWNFGYSPGYTLTNRVKSGNSVFDFLVKVKNGIIQHFEITGNGTGENQRLSGLLCGVPHEEKVIENILEKEQNDTGLIFPQIPVILQGLF